MAKLSAIDEARTAFQNFINPAQDLFTVARNTIPQFIGKAINSDPNVKIAKSIYNTVKNYIPQSTPKQSRPTVSSIVNPVIKRYTTIQDTLKPFSADQLTRAFRPAGQRVVEGINSLGKTIGQQPILNTPYVKSPTFLDTAKTFDDQGQSPISSFLSGQVQKIPSQFAAGNKYRMETQNLIGKKNLTPDEQTRVNDYMANLLPIGGIKTVAGGLAGKAISSAGRYSRGGRLISENLPTETEIENRVQLALGKGDLYTQRGKKIAEMEGKPFIEKDINDIRQSFKRFETLDNMEQLEAIPPSSLTRDVSKFKDISGFSGGNRDIYRNFKVVFGTKFPEVKKQILDPFDDAKGGFIDMQKNYLKGLDENIVKKYGFKKGSKESAAIQQLGEGMKDYNTIVKEFGQTKAKQIQESVKWFRSVYDDLLTQINTARKQIYGANTDKLIPRRNDYFRHFREIAQGYKGLVNIFDTPANISSELSGISEFTKPKSKWLSLAQKRLGMKTEIDAIGGYLDYLKAASYATNIDPMIPKFRRLAGELVHQTAEGTEHAGKLNNTIEFLHDFANDLAGKTNPLDRATQKWIPGGRKTFKALTWANNRVKANVILGNLSSSVAQIFNVPAGIANAGVPNAVRGLSRSFASMFTKNKPMESSNFIKERYFNEYDKFNTDLLNNPRRFAKWMVTALDEVGTKYIWNTHYEMAISKKFPDPVRFADNVTRRLVAGRGIGEVPLVQKSKIFQLVAPFQLEVANLWHVMKDFVDEKAFGKLATLFVMNYVFNQGAKAIRGNPVTFDPIQATIDAIGELNTENGALKAGGRLAGEVISNVPLGQTAASFYPEFGATIGGKQLPTRKEFFGRSDPTRFGGGGLLTKGIQDPLYKLLPPFGGQQIKRTVDAAKVLLQNGDFDKSGRLKFEAPQNPLGQAQSLLFGKYSTPQGQEYLKTLQGQGLSGPEKQAQSFSSEFQNEQAVDKKQQYQMYQQFNKAKTPDERRALLSLWEEQGLLTNDVLDEFINLSDKETQKTEGQWAKAVRKASTSNEGKATFIAKSLQGKSPDEKREIFRQLEEAGLLTNNLLDAIIDADDLLNQKGATP